VIKDRGRISGRGFFLRTQNLTSAAVVQQVVQLIQAGERSSAAEAIAALVADGPALGELWLQLANSALSIGETSLAESAARNYLAIDREQTQRQVQCAAVIAETGDLDKALKLIKPGLNRHPADATLNHFCGTVYQQLGELQKAATHLHIVLRSASLSGATWLTLAAQHRFITDDVLLERLVQLAGDFARTDPVNRVQYHYALGKALLDLQHYDQAFDEFSKGALLAPGRNLYSASAEAAQVESVIAGYPQAAPPSASGRDSNRAIFLLGLARSGTTLLQRILGAHQSVTDGGEFAGMGVATMDYRRKLEAGAAVTLEEVETCYLHLAKERFAARGMIVDKSINNLFYAGIIADTFPTAPIILLERNVHDVVWSCFRTCFNKGMHWSWALPDIATHIRAERRLMEHWKEVMAERLIVVQYEALVRDPAQVLPDLFARCGLDFNKHVYNFYQRKSPVMTSSVAQVKKPLNADSVGSAQHVIHRLTGLGSL
jgi:tetratricopeptide (TPR) repeat protein